MSEENDFLRGPSVDGTMQTRGRRRSTATLTLSDVDSLSSIYAGPDANGRGCGRRRLSLTLNDVDVLMSIYVPPVDVATGGVDDIAASEGMITSRVFSTAHQDSHDHAMKNRAVRRATLTHADVDMLFSIFEPGTLTEDLFMLSNKSTPAMYSNTCSSRGQALCPSEGTHLQLKMDDHLPPRRFSLQQAAIIDSPFPAYLTQICEALNKSREDCEDASDDRMLDLPLKRPSSLVPHETNKRKHDLLSNGFDSTYSQSKLPRAEAAIHVDAKTSLAPQKGFRSSFKPLHTILSAPSHSSASQGINRERMVQLVIVSEKSQKSQMLLHDSIKRTDLKESHSMTMSKSSQTRREVKKFLLKNLMLSQQNATSA